MSKHDLEREFINANAVTESVPQYGAISYHNEPKDPPRYAGGGKVAKAALKKASEALGEHEGKYLNITQSDRMRVGGKDLGGPGFPTLSLERPEYEGAVWGVGNPAVASTIIGANKRYPEGQAIWTTMLGSPEQHRSNQHVFDELYKQFKKSAKEGNLDPVLHDAINQRLRQAVDKDGVPLFPEDVDILSKKFRSFADRFDKRAVAADVMGGVGLGGKKGQIFDYDKVMERMTDPLVKDAPAGSLGYRLFTLSGEKSERPDLHSAFPHILHGEDLGVSYSPAPREIIMQKFIDDFQQKTGRLPTYLDWTRGYAPSTQITEEMLTNLQREGFAKGGRAKLEDEFRKENTVDMTGFRRNPMDIAVDKVTNKESPYQTFAKLLKRAVSTPIRVGEALGSAAGQQLAEDVQHVMKSPTGGRDFIKNLAADLAGQLEESQPMAELYRAYKGEKPMREKVLGDTKELPALTIGAEMLSPVVAGKAGKVVKALENMPAGMSIKPVGGQWFPRGVERELEDVKMADSESPLNKAVNAWVDGPLRKYLMNRMGTENDEVRKLFDEGIHHVDPANLNLSNYVEDIEANRRFNYHGRELAKTSRGRAWEDASDSAIFPRVAGNLGSHVKESYPWINKLPPEEKIYALSSNMENNPDVMRNLGFDHVIDVLKNDILEGKLRPEQLNKVSIEDAIKRTHNYNIEMAKKAEEAGIVTQQGLPVHREYPEGYKWVELKHPEGDKKRLDEIEALLYGNRLGGEWKPRQYGNGEIYLYKEDPYTKVQGVPANQTLVDSSGRPKFFSSLEEAEAEAGNLNSKGRLSEDDVKALQEERRKLSKEYAEDQTKKALQYEGDTMGHCVGSYCEDVMGGHTRIFSLRDAEGKPHVTIEVKPEKGVVYSQMADLLGEKEVDRLLESGMSPRQIVDAHPELQELRTYKINQIKGKGNAKPADKYLPYVQDFVKNPVAGKEWADVGDFRNTDLIDVRAMREHGVLPDMDTEGTNQILQEIDRLYPTEKTPTGGLVFEGQYGRLIPNTDMLKYEVQDLPSPYLTKEDIIEHLRKREPRPVEQSYSKYWNNKEYEDSKKLVQDALENPDHPSNFANGGRAISKGKEVIKRLVEEFSGEPQIAKAPEKVLPRNVAYNTYEQVPYAYSKHLEGMPEKSYAEKLDFTNEANWEKNNDLLAEYLGMKSEPSQRGVGLYTPPVEGAATEMNPQISTRTRVSTDQQRRWRNETTPESQGSMSAMGATRGYFDVQGASPWVKPSEGGKRKYSAFHVVIDGKPTQEEMMKLGEIQNKYGFYGTSDLGKSGVFIGFNFDYGPKELKSMRKAFESDVKDALGNRVKGVKMVKSEGDYPGYEGKWEEPQGSGAVTRQLMEYLDTAKGQNPLLAEFYAQRPSTELQKLMESMNIRDIKAPEKFGVGAPRKDVLNAREIFAREGIEGLRKALEGGAYLPAVGVIGLEGLDNKR